MAALARNGYRSTIKESAGSDVINPRASSPTAKLALQLKLFCTRSEGRHPVQTCPAATQIERPLWANFVEKLLLHRGMGADSIFL